MCSTRVLCETGSRGRFKPESDGVGARPQGAKRTHPRAPNGTADMYTLSDIVEYPQPPATNPLILLACSLTAFRGRSLAGFRAHECLVWRLGATRKLPRVSPKHHDAKRYGNRPGRESMGRNKALNDPGCKSCRSRENDGQGTRAQRDRGPDTPPAAVNSRIGARAGCPVYRNHDGRGLKSPGHAP